MNTFVDSEGTRQMETSEEEEEEEEQRVMALITLHSAPFPFPQKMNIPELSHNFSSVAWCKRSNIIACATETCSRDPGSNQQPAFWIPIHVLDPERPTEHAIFNVTADSPQDAVQFLEWSPVSCAQALLVGNVGGSVTIWSQPTQGTSNVAYTINCWSCEHEWRQEQAVSIKWVTGLSPYRWSPTQSVASPSSKSLEERFLSHLPRSSVRWPNFFCICSTTYSGSVQLHWRQWPSPQSGLAKWFSTNKAVLGAGPSGLFAADAIVTDTGSLVVAGTPVGTPSTVIVWEISPWVVNTPGGSQQALKYGMPIQTPLAFGPPQWPGIAPLAAYLMSWQEQPGIDTKPGQSYVENDEKPGPFLYCTPISNLSAYVTPEASTLTTWGSGVSGIAFDPSCGGSALITVVCEGYFIAPEAPDDGPSLTGWRCQRWESARQPVAIHPLFDSGNGNYSASHAAITSWTAVSSKVLSPTNNTFSDKPASGCPASSWKKGNLSGSTLRPANPRCITKLLFSGHGGEFALSLISGEVSVFSGYSLSPIGNSIVRSGSRYPPAVAFSPTSCCLATVWHNKKSDCSVLKILCLDPCTPAGTQGAGGSLTWERHLADRFWWSLVSEVDWWDIIACTQYAVEDGAVTVSRVAAVLDTDFHTLPSALHRQSYSTALDRIKCRMLEGIDAADIRALVLDMQARLLLDMLGKGIEASLINPSTLVAEPWLASSETLSGLGTDAMTVDSALVISVQAYVDSILDLASHFLTRLRRYASFCRTLASHANPAAANSSRPGVNSSNGGTVTQQSGQAPQQNAGSSAGPAGVQAWVQGAIAKMNSNAEGAPSSAQSTGLNPASLPLTVSTATFPGIPAVRLIGDCHFLHRLCQLLFFCLIFRKRQVPRFAPGQRMSSDSVSAAGKGIGGVVPKPEDLNTIGPVSRTSIGGSNVKVEDSSRGSTNTKSEEAPNSRLTRIGNGNAGQGYTAEEVKYLFLVLVDLCKRTAMQPHPMPKSQIGASNPVMKLHYIEGQYTVTPEVVEGALQPHMQQLPRPRGADAAGLLMRELELHPPAEEWNRRSMSFRPVSCSVQYDLESWQEEDQDSFELWPRKRRYAERDAAFGLRTAIGLGSFSGFMGSRRDVITAVWKTAQHGIWHRCMRCGRQTAALAAPTLASAGSVMPTSSRETWWTGRWAYGCPMCGGRWGRML